MAARRPPSRSGKRGYQGSIALLGEESDPPYERPPLSKDYLAGDEAVRAAC